MIFVFTGFAHPGPRLPPAHLNRTFRDPSPCRHGPRIRGRVRLVPKMLRLEIAFSTKIRFVPTASLFEPRFSRGDPWPSGAEEQHNCSTKSRWGTLSHAAFLRASLRLFPAQRGGDDRAAVQAPGEKKERASGGPQPENCPDQNAQRITPSTSTFEMMTAQYPVGLLRRLTGYTIIARTCPVRSVWRM